MNKIKLKIKLKSCPFCGNTKIFVGQGTEIQDNTYNEQYAVCCDFQQGGCGACSGYRLTKTEAIKIWNGRV